MIQNIWKNAQSFTFATLSIWLIAFVLLVCNVMITLNMLCS